MKRVLPAPIFNVSRLKRQAMISQPNSWEERQQDTEAIAVDSPPRQVADARTSGWRGSRRRGTATGYISRSAATSSGNPLFEPPPRATAKSALPMSTCPSTGPMPKHDVDFELESDGGLSPKIRLLQEEPWSRNKPLLVVTVTPKVLQIRDQLGGDEMLLELFGVLNSVVMNDQRNSRKTFVLSQADEEDSIRCSFYEMDRPMPRVMRKSWLRCVGSFDGERTFRCFSVRSASDEEVQNVASLVAFSEGAITKLVQTREQ